MGYFKQLNEALRTIRSGGYSQDRAVQVDDNIPVVGTEMTDSEVMQLINKIKAVSYERQEKLKDYEYMSKDGIIGGALELLADESTICDITTTLPFWVESENKEFETYMNTWLKETIKIQNKAWLYAYRLVRDGEIFLRTYNSTKDSESVDKLIRDYITVGDYFELIDNPSEISELTLCDNTIGYQYKDPDFMFNDKILDEDEFIHVYRDTGERQTILVSYNDKKTGIRETKFKVPYGTSYLDSSRQSFLILDLLDTMVLSQRINKNQILRLISVEVGNANRTDTRNAVNEVKQAFKTSALEKDKAFKAGAKNGTVSNIYIPTRQGKGNVSVDEVGGNIDVKDLTDLEYYTNKLFASLRVPKEMLNFNESSFFADGSMTKKDVRFARMVKSIKALLTDLVQKMVEFKKSKTKWSSKDIKYYISSCNVPSAEDTDNIEVLNTAMSIATSLRDFLQDNSKVSEDDLMKYIFLEILRIPDFSDFYSNKDVPVSERVPNPEGDDENGFKG